MGVIDTAAYISPFGNDYQMDFPNLDKTTYYYNERQIFKIRKLINKKNYKKLKPALENYVKLFGIENFKRTAYLESFGPFID